jgi:hypothetical protein
VRTTEKSDRTKSSKIKYRRPATAIMDPAIMLVEVSANLNVHEAVWTHIKFTSSTFMAFRSVKLLIAKQEMAQVRLKKG